MDYSSTLQIDGLIEIGAVPNWAIPIDLLSFANLLKRSDALSFEQVNQLLDAAGDVPEAACDALWTSLCRRVSGERALLCSCHSYSSVGHPASDYDRPTENSVCGLQRQDFESIWIALCWWAFKFVQDWQIAEDISQKAFLEAHRARKRYDPTRGASVRTYLFSIAKHRAIDWCRQHSRSKHELALDADFFDRLPSNEGRQSDETPESTNADLASRLDAAIASLAPHQQRLMRAKLKYPDATTAELARSSAVSIQSSYKLMQQALGHLRKNDDLRNTFGGNSADAANP